MQEAAAGPSSQSGRGNGSGVQPNQKNNNQGPLGGEKFWILEGCHNC